MTKYENIIAKPDKEPLRYVDATLALIDAILSDTEIVYVEPNQDPPING